MVRSFAGPVGIQVVRAVRPGNPRAYVELPDTDRDGVGMLGKRHLHSPTSAR
jgi:hypothetical protein